jgi:hypothetical protein
MGPPASPAVQGKAAVMSQTSLQCGTQHAMAPAWNLGYLLTE